MLQVLELKEEITNRGGRKGGMFKLIDKIIVGTDNPTRFVKAMSFFCKEGWQMGFLFSFHNDRSNS